MCVCVCVRLQGFLYIISCHQQIQTILLFPFWFECFLFLCLAYLFWLGLPIQCWIKLVRIGIVVSFSIPEEKLLAFCNQVCFLWTGHIWPLLCWSTIPLYPVFESYHETMLSFVKCFCIYRSDHMVFIIGRLFGKNSAIRASIFILQGCVLSGQPLETEPSLYPLK